MPAKKKGAAKRKAPAARPVKVESTHDRLLREARAAVDALFNDESVTLEERVATAHNLDSYVSSEVALLDARYEEFLEEEDDDGSDWGDVYPDDDDDDDDDVIYGDEPFDDEDDAR